MRRREPASSVSLCVRVRCRETGDRLLPASLTCLTYPASFYLSPLPYFPSFFLTLLVFSLPYTLISFLPPFYLLFLLPFPLLPISFIPSLSFFPCLPLPIISHIVLYSSFSLLPYPPDSPSISLHSSFLLSLLQV